MSNQMDSGSMAISKQRHDQLIQHGFTVEGDAAAWPNAELKKAALVLIDPEHNDKSNWPLDPKWYEKIIEKPFVEQLAIAGALLAAQIDVLNLAEKRGWWG